MDSQPPPSSATDRKAGLLLAVAVVAWVMLVVTAYFAVHKPATPQQLVALGSRLRTLAGLLATLSLAMALGRLWRSALSPFSGRARLTLQLGLGMASLTYLVLILGALRGYHSVLAWGLAVVALPFGIPALISGLRDALPRTPRGPGGLALAAFVAALLGLAALRGLAPPTAWDSLVYHLTGPKLYLEAGSLQHGLDLPYLGFPQAGSMLFTWGMLLSGDRLAQWVHLLFAVLTLSLLPQALGRLAPGRSWLAAALLIGVPTASLLAGVAYVEWMVMFAGLASFVLLSHRTVADRSPSVAGPKGGLRADWIDRRMVVAAGFAAAMALNSKYTAVWLVVGLAAAVFQRSRTRSTVLFLGSVGAFLMPFLLKNLLLTGNPVYPFFLPGEFWDSHRAFWYSRPGSGLSVAQLLLAPWEATVWGVEGGAYLGHPSYGASLGPLILALAPASLLLLRRGDPEQRRRLRGLLMVAGFGYLGWLAQLGFSGLMVQSRLLFPVLPYLALLAAAGFDAIGGLDRWGGPARFVVGGLVGLALSLTGLQTALDFSSNSPLAVVSGAETQESYLRSSLGQYALAMESLRSLPAYSKVRFLWEPRAYYCPAEIQCEPDALIDRWWHTRQHWLQAGAVASQWKEEGVTHVLFYPLGAEAIRQAGFDPLTASDWTELESFLSDQLIPIKDFGEAYTLYRWR
jgi:hypothetical protein